MQWLTVCSVDDLQPDAGVCALVNGQQVAVFLVPGKGSPDKIYGLSNYDPFGKANVLSRGIVGDLKGLPVVASPLHKQHFNLQTGVCLEDDSVILPVYACRIEHGAVQLSMHPLPGHDEGLEYKSIDQGSEQISMAHEGVAG